MVGGEKRVALAENILTYCLRNVNNKFAIFYFVSDFEICNQDNRRNNCRIILFENISRLKMLKMLIYLLTKGKRFGMLSVTPSFCYFSPCGGAKRAGLLL